MRPLKIERGARSKFFFGYESALQSHAVAERSLET